jgi:hypothetical protein
MVPRRAQFCSGFLLILVVLVPTVLFAQKKAEVITTTKPDSATKVVIAGPYGRSGFHEMLFGRHYRREWVTPVTVPVFDLDTLDEDGMTPYKASGGTRNKSLRLRDSDGREYVLRSLDRSFGPKLKPIYRGTFLERALDDQVSIDHPYAALTIPEMAEAAKVYHTEPRIGYVPSQDALDSFSSKYGDHLYLLEQRPDGNWETADNFGRATKIIGTDNMLENLLASHANQVDQLLYVRSRLFDMLIGDWDRGEDHWRWGAFNSSEGITYKPIPRDREQAYSKFDGILSKHVFKLVHLDHLQSFDYTIKNVKAYGFTARHLDRRCANEVTLQQWVDIAKDIQLALTDDIIKDAIKQMPPEVFPISGPAIIETIKGRRDHLVEFAEQYYRFLARHVDVVGSAEREYFDIRRVNDNETSVQIYGMDENGAVESEPRYSRVFKTDETKDVRIYGIAGNDRYVLNGKVNDGIEIRIIGGPDKDAITDNSLVAGHSRKTIIYEDWDNTITPSSETRLRISTDSVVHEYDYEEYEYHKRGLLPLVTYDNPDRVFVNFGVGFDRHRWRKDPYGFSQGIYARYTLGQNAISLLYDGIFYDVFKKWNLFFMVNYDFIRQTNFFDLGNDTKYVYDLNFYRLRTNELTGTIGLYRMIRKHRFDVRVSFQSIGVLNDPYRLVSETYATNNNYYLQQDNFLLGRAGYTYVDLDSRAVPEKGVVFYAGAAYTGNFEEQKKSFATYNSILQVYVPLIHKFSLSVRAGVASVQGTPEFYQYSSVGGAMNIRGFVLDRFWGNTAFYNSNELRYITNLRSYLMNGKIGLLVLLDNGRVWYEPESSSTWHYGYGGGLILAPFNKFTGAITYAQSVDGGLVQVRINTFL